MGSICRLVFLSLLFNLNGFISAGVFHQDGTSIAKDISNLVTLKTRKAIELTKWLPVKPLIFFTALKETALLNVTSQSLNGKITNPVSVGSATGGFLGSAIYNIYSFNVYWGPGNCSETRKLTSRVLYYNQKYGSYKKALHFPDGIISADIDIATNGDLPNPQFTALSEQFSSATKPGDYIEIQSGFTFTWYVNFPPTSSFQTYKKKFFDEEYGKYYVAQVIALPSIPCLNFISNQQYQDTFGRIERISNNTFPAGLFDDTDIAQKKTYTGLKIYNLLA